MLTLGEADSLSVPNKKKYCRAARLISSTSLGAYAMSQYLWIRLSPEFAAYGSKAQVAYTGITVSTDVAMKSCLTIATMCSGLLAQAAGSSLDSSSRAIPTEDVLL